MASSNEYAPLRGTGRVRLRWRMARRLARIDPQWPWWAAWAAAATVLGVLLDLAGVLPWWIGPPVGVALGVGTVALTALDDLRRPVASIAVLVAELRWPSGTEPGRVDAVRARRFDIPLYAPPDTDDAWLRGGGASYPRGLFAATRRRIRVGWDEDDGPATAETAQTDGDGDRRSWRWIHSGWIRTTPHEIRESEASGSSRDDPPDPAELEAAVVAIEVRLDGQLRPGRAVDLRPWGGGWAATVQVDEQHRVDLTGHGRLPDPLVLTRRVPATLVRAAR